MASGTSLRAFSLLVAFLMLEVEFSLAAPKLSPCYYQKTCPMFLKISEQIVLEATRREQRTGASILRLHFHDCMVAGCDGSILLDPGAGIDSEKVNVTANASLRDVAFRTIDDIKTAVDSACGPSIVSCADILAVASRDSVVALGGPTWAVPLGRRDATTASSQLARDSLPTPVMELPKLIELFKKQGLDRKDLVALSGGHTVGFASCIRYRKRIYNATNIDGSFAKKLQKTCPVSGGDDNIAEMDDSPSEFDNQYFKDLMALKGVLESDQTLYNNGGSTDRLVEKYSKDTKAFTSDFVKSMIKMGNLKPLTGDEGEVRLNCRNVN